MTKAQTAKLLAVVAAAYPSFEVDETRVEVWRELLGDLDFELLGVAVRRHITSSRFAPTVAEIREQAMRASGSEQMTAGEAWGAVHEAVQIYGYYRPQEGLDSLPPLVARAAKQIGWSQICLETEVGVLRGQFMRVFEQLARRAEREETLPLSLRRASLDQVGQIEGGDE